MKPSEYNNPSLKKKINSLGVICENLQFAVPIRVTLVCDNTYTKALWDTVIVGSNTHNECIKPFKFYAKE